LGEGNTPLVWVDYGESKPGKKLAVKCEFLEPSGSFKDRGSALIVSFLISRGIKVAMEDSSGNAGASLAAYAARAGIQAKIYIPETTSGPKRSQIEAYGTEVIAIPGARPKATEALIHDLEKEQERQVASLAYASHAYLPFNIPGYATISYELVEQLGEAPGTVIAPVGQGGLLLGIGRGFKAMQTAGHIAKLPVLIGVQAEACAPLWAVSNYGRAGLALFSEGETIAEGIRVRAPVRGDEVMRIVENSGGRFITVNEEEISAGKNWLAKNGFYVEPTSAVVWGAWNKLIDHLPDPVVAVLTGSGMKTKSHPNQ
jgi:threonine synthase